MTRKLALAVAASLLTISLGACSGRDDDVVYADNSSDATPASAEEVAPATPEPAPAPVATTETVNTAAVDDTPPPAPSAPDEQMMDDASATGMTARAHRNAPTTEASPASDTGEDK